MEWSSGHRGQGVVLAGSEGCLGTEVVADPGVGSHAVAEGRGVVLGDGLVEQVDDLGVVVLVVEWLGGEVGEGLGGDVDEFVAVGDGAVLVCG